MTTPTETVPTAVAPDSYTLSRRLHDRGVSAINVARNLLGYSVLGSFDAATFEQTGEAYATSCVDNSMLFITRDQNDVPVFHLPYGVDGKFCFNMVDFVQIHNRDVLKTPLEAARHICRNSRIDEDTADAVTAPVVPRELDLNYAVSRRLQDAGLPLCVIAANLGFSVRKPNAGDEYYIYRTPADEKAQNPQAAFVAAIATNCDGLEIAHYIDPVDGRNQVCAVRFAMQHGGAGYESTLAATDSLWKMLRPSPALLAA